MREVTYRTPRIDLYHLYKQATSLPADGFKHPVTKFNTMPVEGRLNTTNRAYTPSQEFPQWPHHSISHSHLS